MGHFLFQLFLARFHLDGHLTEDARQLPQFVQFAFHRFQPRRLERLSLFERLGRAGDLSQGAGDGARKQDGGEEHARISREERHDAGGLDLIPGADDILRRHIHPDDGDALSPRIQDRRET